MQEGTGIQMPVCENRPPDERIGPPFVRRTIVTSRGFESPVGGVGDQFPSLQSTGLSWVQGPTEESCWVRFSRSLLSVRALAKKSLRSRASEPHSIGGCYL